MTENRYPAFRDANTTYLHEMQTYGFKRVHEVTEAGKALTGTQLTEFLTAENEKTTAYVIKKTKDMIAQLMLESFNYSKLSFKMDKNL